MLRIIISAAVLFSVFPLTTCERTDMHKLARYGEPPRMGLYVFAISSRTGALGGRSGADQLCRDEGVAVYRALDLKNVKAFISVSTVDDIRSLVTPDWWYYPVYGINPVNGPVLVAESWAGLWSGALVNDLQTSLGMTTNWWSGSNPDGTLSAGGNCSEWRVADSTLAQEGSPVGTAPSWITATMQACSASNTVLCLAY